MIDVPLLGERRPPPERGPEGRHILQPGGGVLKPAPQPPSSVGWRWGELVHLWEALLSGQEGS